MAKLYKREFLNPKEGTAFSEVSAETGENYIDAHMKIADCNHIATLEFSIYDESNKTRRERIEKLKRLIGQAEMLKAFLEANPL